jgi:hypothetical protein
MDFIARASGVLERSQRLTGVLLIICVVEAVVLVTYFSGNRDLNELYRQLREESKVYVVPGASAGLYAPTRRDFLLQQASVFITQSFNTFTAEQLQGQYLEAKKFFSPNMIAASEKYFEDLINKTFQDRRSALFMPNMATYRVNEELTNTGKKVQKVVVFGTVQYIIDKRVLETEIMRIEMRMAKAPITQTNSFGYILESYKARPLSNEDLNKYRQGTLNELL